MSQLHNIDLESNSCNSTANSKGINNPGICVEALSISSVALVMKITTERVY